MMIDLKRLGARNWELLEWEGDIWDTMDPRPCVRLVLTRWEPVAKHGPYASTAAGEPAPLDQLSTRTASPDIYRRRPVYYAEDEEE